MEYQEVLDYLYAQLPMFHRIGPAAYKADLTNTVELLKSLGNPERHFKTVHVAGTNGKGSTSHMLAAIFAKAGYKTALYTSPHLVDFRERIRINGRMISKEAVVDFVGKYRSLFEPVQPSFFEWTVALAFHHFNNEHVDIAVIETGLGGRLDSTNVILPELSVITNIGMDHCNLLGDTLQKIAVEKAGIIKREVPVVVGERMGETEEVFMAAAKQAKAPIVFASDATRVERIRVSPEKQVVRAYYHDVLWMDDLELDLPGVYQLRNLATVLESVRILKDKGWELPDDTIRSALANVRTSTGLMGRWQQLSEHPSVICDVGHNAEGIAEVVRQLKAMNPPRLHMVFGMVKDKDISRVLTLLPKTAGYYFCAPALPRALPVSELKELASAYGLVGAGYDSVQGALKAALSAANQQDLIFIGGSTFVVAEVLSGLQDQKVTFAR